jgi:hypothetical protein
MYTQQDAELQTLLDLDGIIYPLIDDFWKNVDQIVKEQH